MPATLLLLFGLLSTTGPVQPAVAPAERVTALVAALERGLTSGNRDAVRALGQDADVLADLVLALTSPPPQRVVLKERDRTRVEGKGYRLLLEVFWERGREGRLSTWSLDVEESGGQWRF